MSANEEKHDLSALRIDRSKRMSDRPRRRRWLYLLWIIVPALLILGYLQLKQKVTSATSVQVATARMLTGPDAEASLVATGYVVAQRKAEVASKGTGRLVFLGFEEGDRVQKGDTIAQLDNADIKAELALARARLEAARVDTLGTGRTYRRQQKLFKDGAITDVDLEAAEVAYKNALAALEAARASVRVAEVNVDNTYIRAPFDGTVLTKNADVGEIVAPFASSSSSKGSVVTLADMGSLEVEADVSESNITKVSVGQRCEIILDAYPDVRYAGHVKKIVPTADRARATVLTKVAFDNKDDRVLPEMSARVNFYLNADTAAAGQAKEALVVPKEAVTRRNGQELVFRVEGDKVTAVPVTIGRQLGGSTEILSGLNAGEQVVLSPPGKLETGQKIEISR
jgi:RND family efflux transporter MFP subunit